MIDIIFFFNSGISPKLIMIRKKNIFSETKIEIYD